MSTTTTPKTILILGGTGNQGGALIRALLTTSNTNTPIQILAVTRDPTTPHAQSLLSSLPKHPSTTIQLIQGDLSDVPALFTTALEASPSNSIWGVYSVQAKPANDAGIPLEEVQGKAVIDASISQNVSFFVYSSVDRGGVEMSSDNPTTVPHWATKHRVEKHLEEKTQNGEKMRYCVLRPTAFMENLSNDFAGKAMAASWSAVLKHRKLQLVAIRDIGWFGAEAFLHPEEFAGTYLSLAGAELSFEEANQIFKEKVGSDMPATYGCVAKALLHVVKSLGAMFEWLKKNQGGADVEALRRMKPDLMDFGTWLEKDSQFRKK
ncbi:nucleoside-diphosphate-sugar epimerase family protein [Periconia macrospinosa]|uniref:Nucleoside-diphosphate-sugar epimerase family protein n=1 Tax=Periconia macrospinosa TaxID=97972 RepID=A0A2V1E2A6_9PLEO|nr:nucleoside-diphosphate-sugar epimerase family protein [Periconia macrospinosa]